MTTIKLVQEDLNKDGKVTLSERVQAALMLWLVLFVTLNIIYVCVVVVFHKQGALELWLGFWLPAYVALDTIGVAAVAVWRLILYERAELVERDERKWKRKREQWEFDQMRKDDTTERETRGMTPHRQAFLAKWYIQRYFEGKSITRQACIKAGWSKPEWDHINDLMVKRGIRDGRKPKLKQETPEAALLAWNEGDMKSRKWVRAGDDEFVKV